MIVLMVEPVATWVELSVITDRLKVMSPLCWKFTLVKASF